MPWSKVSDAPANIRQLNGVDLTLDQMNWIANVADGVKGEYAWAIAISKFKKSFKVEGDSWTKNTTEEKEFSDVIVEKQDNGKYKIISVSTAALKDREGETFTTQAIDYEIEQAKSTGEYPEFKVFHVKPLGIGRVKSMKRVGIFAVEEGESYDDAFSLDVCEKMLSTNDGRWKMSRGFKVLEESGGCPHCGESLLIRTKHMVAGFRCPSCNKVYLGSKGSLNGVRFLKTKTFDITVTDVPAVPWTGVAAFPSNGQEDFMNKKELKKRLLNAGLSEEAIDSRLDLIAEETLKSFDDIPDAEILKEFQEESEGGKEEQLFTLDEAVLKEFSRIAKEQLTDLLEGAVLESEDDEDVEEKEASILETLGAIQDQLKELSDAVSLLTEKDDKRLKEMISDAPRGSTLKISRFKNLPPKKSSVNEDEDDIEDEEDDEEEYIPTKKSKEFKESLGKIVGSDGVVAKTMTDFVRGAGSK